MVSSGHIIALGPSQDREHPCRPYRGGRRSLSAGLCALCCVLCAVCCVLCAMYCVLCAVCCVLCAMCCVLYAACRRSVYISVTRSVGIGSALGDDTRRPMYLISPPPHTQFSPSLPSAAPRSFSPCWTARHGLWGPARGATTCLRTSGSRPTASKTPPALRTVPVTTSACRRGGRHAACATPAVCASRCPTRHGTIR